MKYCMRFIFLIIAFSAFVPRISVGQQSAAGFEQSHPYAATTFTVENIHYFDEEPFHTAKNRIVIVKSFDPGDELCSIKSGDTVRALSGEFKEESQTEKGAIYFHGTVQKKFSENCKNLLDRFFLQGAKVTPGLALCRWVQPECERLPQKIEIILSGYITPFFYDFSKKNEETFVPPWRAGDDITLMEKKTYTLWRNSHHSVFIADPNTSEDIASSNRKPFAVFHENHEEDASLCAIKTGEQIKISHGNIRYEGTFWGRELVFVGQIERENKLSHCRHFRQTVKIILPERLEGDFFGFSRWNPLRRHTLFINPLENY